MCEKKPIVATYLALFNSNLRDDAFLNSIPFDKVSRVYLAFIHPSDFKNKAEVASLHRRCEFKDISGGVMRRVVRRARAVNPAIEIYATSGLGKEDYANCVPGDFAKSLLALLQSFDLDGYDMDWESSIHKVEMDALLCAARQELSGATTRRGKPFRVTAAVLPTTWRYDLGEFTSCVDDVNIMTYGRDVGALDVPEKQWAKQ